MTTYRVIVAVPDEDEELATKTLSISADSMEYDETGVLEFSEGTAGSPKLVAVFSPQIWLWAHQKGRATEQGGGEE